MKTWVESAAFSVDGKLLVTGCYDDHIYTWDISATLREACLDGVLSHNANLNPVSLRGVLHMISAQHRMPTSQGLAFSPSNTFLDRFPHFRAFFAH
jgi:WD40 repeat protein